MTTTIDSKRIEQLKAKREEIMKSQYFKKEWHTIATEDITFEEYAQILEPALQSLEGNPVIIAKENSKGVPFYKVAFNLNGGGVIEFDVTYKKDIPEEDEALEDYFEEGDELDISTVLFRKEVYLTKSHWYVTGKCTQ